MGANWSGIFRRITVPARCESEKRFSEKSVVTQFLDQFKAGDFVRGPGLLSLPTRAPGRLEMLLIAVSLTIITKENENLDRTWHFLLSVVVVVDDVFCFLFTPGNSMSLCLLLPHAQSVSHQWLLRWSLNGRLMQPNSWNKKIPEVRPYGVKT